MPPTLAFALLLATIYGLFFHALFGRRFWQLPCYLLVAIVGFLAGQVLGTMIGLDLARVGNVPIVAATSGAFLGLAACWFFTTPIPEPSAPRRRRASRSQQPGDQVSA
jgi:membrane associated rhomboid family serine protease